MEEALIFFETKNWPYWRIEQGTKRLDHDDSGDIETSKLSLMNHLALLTPGGYTLKVRPGLKADAGQVQLDFIIARTPKTNTTTMQANNTQSVTEMVKIAEENAYKRAMADFEIKQELKELRAFCVRLETKIDDAILKLSDDDEENDKPALQTLADIGSMLPGLSAGLKSIVGKA